MEDVCSLLQSVLIDLIESQGADLFYVGSQGGFDRMVQKTLRRLQMAYPHIQCTVVLAYMPGEQRDTDTWGDFDTIFPDGLETTPRRFAISKQNRWMIEQADTVITYVAHSFGNAAKFKALAEKKEKRVINLSDKEKSTSLG